MNRLFFIFIAILSLQFVLLSCSSTKQIESSKQQIKTADDFNKQSIKSSSIEKSKNQKESAKKTKKQVLYDKTDSKLDRSSKFLTSNDIRGQDLGGNKPLANNFDTTKCDLIILENGREVAAKVKVVGEDEIKYKKCSNLSGPLYKKPKNKVFIIKYANGAKDVFNNDQTKNKDVEINNNNQVGQESNDQDNAENKSLDGFSLAGGIIGIVSGVLAFIPVPPVAWILFLIISITGLVFSIIGLARVTSNRDSLGGLGWAITGLIINTLAILTFIIALAVF